MTREEASQIIQALRLQVEEPTDTGLGWLETWIYKEDVEALRMAIKALEQEPRSEWERDHVILKAYSDGANEVLDKIRAEIEKLRPNLRPEQMTDYDYAMVDVVNDIMAIFDKYKAEK